MNKLKLVKRQGYGRAGFELLRARMPAAWSAVRGRTDRFHQEADRAQ